MSTGISLPIGGPATLSVKEVATATYTVIDGDLGKLLVFTQACVVDVDTGLVEGFRCRMMCDAADSEVTLEGTATIHNKDGHTQSGGQYAVIEIAYSGTTDNYVMTEDTGPPPTLQLPYATDFDGTNDYVDLGSASELQLERTDAFSFAFWIKTTSTATDKIIFSNLEPAGNNNGYEVSNGGAGLFGLTLSNDITTDRLRVLSDVAINDGSWHHVAITYDGSSSASGVNIYIDVAAVATTTSWDNLTASIVSTQDVCIMTRPGSGLYIPGRLCEFAVYDKELSASEITAIGNPKRLNQLVTGPVANMLGYWRMGTGDKYPTTTDHSTSGNDGTMTNMADADLVIDAPPYQ